MVPFKTELDTFLAFLAQIDREFISGESIAQICQRYDLSAEQFDALMNQFAIAPNSPESLTESGMTKIVVPIFRSRRGKDELDQIASGVLLRISSQSFLLTAAHVTDELKEGHLFVPGEREIIGAEGHVSYWKPSEGESRAEDKIDLAYIRLTKHARSRVHSSFRDATLDEISYLNSVASIPFATFAGYPATKARGHGGVRSSEIATYTGHLWTKDMYDRLMYSQERHICIRMRLKNAYSSRHQRKLTAVCPAGISP